MRKMWLAAMASGALLYGSAFADRTTPPAGTQGQGQGQGTGDRQPSMGSTRSGDPGAAVARGDEPKKHLSEVDLYVKDAINNVKVLYETTQLQPGSLDSSIQKEGLANLDRSLSSALVHVSHMQSIPDARVADGDKLVELKSALTDCRGLVGKLRFAIRSDSKTQIQAIASQIASQLRQADDAFAELAAKQHVVRVDQINVPDKQAVSGSTRQNLDESNDVLPDPAGGLDHNRPLHDDTSNMNRQNQIEPTPGVTSPDNGLKRPGLDADRVSPPGRSQVGTTPSEKLARDPLDDAPGAPTSKAY